MVRSVSRRSCSRSLYCRQRRKTVAIGMVTAHNPSTTRMGSTNGLPPCVRDPATLDSRTQFPGPSCNFFLPAKRELLPLRITDRMSRFSKIGGEMLPHIKIKDKLHELSAATEQTFAVTSVPDEKKGND